MVKSNVVCLVLATALGTSGAAYAENDGGRAAFVKASKYFEAEEYEAALPYFRKAYDQSGARPATAFGLAQCLRSLKRYEEAIPLFEEYLASDPDNAASVMETLTLLREIAARRAEKREAAEEAKKRAEAEAKKRREAEEAKKRAEAEAAERRAAEAATAKAAEPPPPAPAPQPAVVPPPEPEVEDGSIVSSPVFWIVTGAAVVGGAIAVGVVASQSGSEYGGNTGRVLSPLGGAR